MLLSFSAKRPSVSMIIFTAGPGILVAIEAFADCVRVLMVVPPEIWAVADWVNDNTLDMRETAGWVRVTLLAILALAGCVIVEFTAILPTAP